jgi:short-subunit dehydrogenase
VNLGRATVVVTGASSGIGRDTAIAFAKAGASLVLAARREDRLRDLAGEIGRHGRRAVAVPTDVTRAEDVARLVAATRDAFGRCDVLVNNAGIPGGGPFLDASPERIDQVVRTNLLAVLVVTKAFLPDMVASGTGHVVNVASIAGLVAVPGAAVYSASKHAVVAFSEALDSEVAPGGVRVTAVCPGLVRTEGFPQNGVPGAFLVASDRVAATIVRAVRKGIAPSVSVPRSAGTLRALHGLAPPLFRAGVRASLRVRPEPRTS